MKTRTAECNNYIDYLDRRMEEAQERYSKGVKAWSCGFEEVRL